MESRQTRGQALALDPHIKQVDGPLWFVPSQKAGGYLVNVDTGTCTCPDHTGQGTKCKHLYAVEIVRAAPVKTDDVQITIAFPAAPQKAHAKQSKGELTAEEQGHVRAALRFLRLQRGGWEPLAKALRLKAKTLTNGSAVSPKLVLRLARVAGVPVDDVLGGRFPPRCPQCGQMMPAPQT